jgi:hypothetical protein
VLVTHFAAWRKSTPDRSRKVRLALFACRTDGRRNGAMTRRDPVVVRLRTGKRSDVLINAPKDLRL